MARNSDSRRARAAASRRPTRRPKRILRRATSELVDPVTAYAHAVGGGVIVAGPHVRNACRRHIQDLTDGPTRGLIWNPFEKCFDGEIRKPVDQVVDFFELILRLNGGQFEGEPFRLDPSQAFILGSLFGWKRRDGSRRFRRAYIEEGKGSGKSPLAAGIGLYCMLADREARAEIYAAASKKDQAMVLFRDAVAMVDQSPKLAERLTKSGGNPVWNLADMSTGSFFRPISSDDGQSGPRPHCALCDEIHEHKNGVMIELLERGFKWRRQPLLVMITNAGSDRQTVCWDEHQHAVRVAAGTIAPDSDFTYVGDVVDDETFSYVAALDKDDDPLEDPTCWVKANPLLGTTITEEYLAGVVRQAKAIPGKLNGILRLHFCEWTDSESAWMSRAALEACLADFDPADHLGEHCFLGADLSATRDMTTLAFAIPTGFAQVDRERVDGGTDKVLLPTFDCWVEAWTPGDTLSERALQDQAPYDVWARDGWLTACAGKLVRYDFIAARIAEAQNQYQVQALAFDHYAFRRQFETELDAFGIEIPLIEHPQAGKRKASESGLWMPGSVNTLEQLILERRIRIRNSPVTIAAIMSAAIEADPMGNRWFSKRRATNRIDALVALTMAIGAATAEAEAAPEYQVFVA